MRKPFSPCALLACALLASCGGGQPSNSSATQNSAPAANTSKSGATATGNTAGVVSSHATAGGGASSGGSDEKPSVPTPELDAKIEKAAAKAKAPGASQADKKTAAAAYLERGNFYYSAGNPRLYKFALGDFRRALRLDPTSQEAREKIKQIEDIYTYSVKRPIPTNGLDEQ